LWERAGVRGQKFLYFTPLPNLLPQGEKEISCSGGIAKFGVESLIFSNDVVIDNSEVFFHLVFCESLLNFKDSNRYVLHVGLQNDDLVLRGLMKKFNI